MFLPERMDQINVLVFESELDEVAAAIVRLNILHLAQLDDQEPWAESLRNFEAADVRGKIEILGNRIAMLMKDLGIDDSSLRPPENLPDISMGDLAEIDRFVSSLEVSLQPSLGRRAEIRKKLERMEAIASEVSPLLELGLPVRKTPYSFLEVHYGEVRTENFEIIKEKIAPLAAVAFTAAKRGKNDLVVVIGLKSDRLKLKRILAEASFEEVEIASETRKEVPQVEGELEKQLESLREDLRAVGDEIAAVRDANVSKITEYYRSLRVAALLLKFKNYLKRTKKTFIFSGWIPADKRKLVEREIMTAAKGRAIVEVHAPEEIAGVQAGRVKVPVLLKHPAFFKPFEMLLSSYGLPDYKVIDPTLFMALTFLFMFGIMFGDVGHGAVLVAIGWLLYRRAADKTSSMALFGRLGMYCGASSIVFGFLFGSLFGLEETIPHLWLKPMNNVMYFFKVAIYYGIGVIMLGIAFNMINSIRTRNFKGLVFDHAGLLVAIMYWAGIVAVSVFLSNEPIPIKLLLFAVGLPVLAIFLKEPIIAVVTHRKLHFEGGIGMYVFESLIEIVEIFTGYLANTVSFIRVAAFSLAHVGLFIAVFSLAEMVKDASGGAVYAGIIHVLGNVGIIALEGLIVSIQAIRLEYYEFFGKFFVSGGVAYKPLGLGASPSREE
jgi:V/A-type H+/Na+-transporting ATPase subunit I